MRRSSEKVIKDLFEFYGTLGRPLTFIELSIRTVSDEVTYDELVQFLEVGVSSGKIITEDGFYWSREFKLSSIGRREQDLFLDEKWKKLESLSHWFRHVPFFDFVMANGSMAFGNVNANSDFDVLTGVRKGRIFTARYFSSALFSILRARRFDDLQESSPDKLCFNHFITRDAYMKPPFNYYRRESYRNMVPLWCSDLSCKEFIVKNGWSGLTASVLLDLHRVTKQKSLFAIFFEKILGGRLGDFVEKRISKPIAMRRLNVYLSNKSTGNSEEERITIGDNELEFHFSLKYEKSFGHLDANKVPQ